MGEKLKVLKNLEQCGKTKRARKQVCNSILETIVGDSAQTSRIFGEGSGRNVKAAAEMTKEELDVVKLELAAAAVCLATPCRAENPSEQEAMQEVIADVRVTRVTLLAERCLAQAKMVAIRDERAAWKEQLANILAGGAISPTRLPMQTTGQNRQKSKSGSRSK